MQIAENGIGTTYPNPSVGAVIVFRDKIIGEGVTSPYGGNHAEVNAIQSVKNKEYLNEATIYVSLEPCAHFGKTPPCADIIIKNKFKNVVVGCRDSNPLVAGKGIERLKKAGCEVLVGILENECRKHHKRFFTFQEKKRPYIILKWAETKDRFIYPDVNETSSKNKSPIWISNSYSQQIVHKLRSKEHAILVGTRTVVADNPKLNVRSWSGKNPVRIVLDRHMKIPKEAAVFDKSANTIVVKDISTKNTELKQNVVFESIDFSKKIAAQICKILQKHKIQSLIVEGGAQTLQTFIDENLWDEAYIFIGNKVFEKGLKSPSIKGILQSEKSVQKDVLKIIIND